MIRLRLTFLAGQYHATPWGRHVNEAVTEWPPSPYRLLRALYDVWQRKCFDLDEEKVRFVLEALAEQPPEFALPKASATHTRSYLSANSTDPTKKNLVFDGFLIFGERKTCWLSWPEVDLEESHREILGRLARGLNYLGRSESWVEAELTEEAPEAEVTSVVAASESDIESEISPVVCAIPPSEYKGKLPWLQALTYSTSNLLKERASAPPLLRLVSYVLPASAIEIDPPRRIMARRVAVREVMIGLDAKVLPLATETLFVAEQIRTRLMGAHKSIVGAEHLSALFSGKTRDGQKRLDHGHLYVLPLQNRDGRIERVLLRSIREDFCDDELEAVRRVRSLWQRDSRGDVQCIVTGQAGLDGFCERGRVVESSTPLVIPRHWRKGRDYQKFLFDEIHRECRNHGLTGEVVEVAPIEKLPGLFHQVEYYTTRRGDAALPSSVVRLTFDCAVAVPFAIGYGAHFGLGQFQLVKQQETAL